MLALISLIITVPPNVMSLITNRRIVATESGSATLRFSIDNASPPVGLFNARWFYSATFTQSLFAGIQDITNLPNRTSMSTLSFSFTGSEAALNISNIVQARSEGQETDQGRYFFQAINEAGSDNDYIDIIVEGMSITVLYDIVHAHTSLPYVHLH